MESNLREAMNFLVQLADEAREPHVSEIEGKTYCDKNLTR